MIRNVIADFLDNIRRERDFDAPFLTLLSAMGFTDVHLTHGPSEKGKDFIGKKDQFQWVFQTKRGDLTVGDLNAGIMAQLHTAATTSLSHPAFTQDLPRQIVLVTTGTVNPQAADHLRSTSDDLFVKLQHPHPPILIWDRNKLVELIVNKSLEGLRVSRMSPTDFEAQGRFFSLYGAIVRRTPILVEFEEHSLSWLDSQIPDVERAFAGSLEGSILSSKCRDGSLLYEALYLELAALRMCMHLLYQSTASSRRIELMELYRSQLETVLASAKDYIEAVWQEWELNDRGLDLAIKSAAAFATYPVTCSRVIETLGLLALQDDEGEARAAVAKLVEFISVEPGVSHPISDRYAVSLVVASLALHRHGREDVMAVLMTRTMVWLCDRTEHGAGLGHVDATVQEEVDQLLGYPFSGLQVEKEHSSLLACALVDLAALTSNKELYEDFVNDLLATDVWPEYYQSPDTEGQFFIDHDDVVHYPGITLRETWDEECARLGYSDYGPLEPQTFSLFPDVGLMGYMCLSLLLRDRYFPSLWPQVQATVS